MKLKVYQTFTPLVCAALFICTASTASETSHLRIQFRGKSINLDRDVSAVAKKEGNQWRIIIGARKNDIMFNFSGTIEGLMKKEGRDNPQSLAGRSGVTRPGRPGELRYHPEPERATLT